MKFVLASNSPRRHQLLTQFDLDLMIASHTFDESSVRKNQDPEEYCRLISRGKAESLYNNYPDHSVLSADTIVVIDGVILEKPIDRDDAIRMLNLLSAREHKVITAVSLFCKNKDTSFSFIEKTFVTFNPLSKEEISYYIDKYDDLHIQGLVLGIIREYD